MAQVRADFVKPTVASSDGSPLVDELGLPRVRSRRGEPTWEMAGLYPWQGHWTEGEYLAIPTKRLVELSDGMIRFLTPPTLRHQSVLQAVFRPLDRYVEENQLGEAFFATVPLRLFPGTWRTPDILFLNPRQVRHAGGEYPHGADLVVEVLMDDEDGRRHDLQTKRLDYAKAGIPEYWIVDPESQTMTVLTLSGKRYKTHGVYSPGESATSVLLDGFVLPVNDAFGNEE